MRALYVVEQGARLARDGEHVRVMLGDVKLESVRPDEIAQCVLMGNVGLTAPAVRALLRGGADVVFLTRGGAFLGRLSSGLSRNIDLRRAQFALLEQPVRALDLAQRMVQGKIENQRRLLRRHQKRRPHDEVAAALARLRHATAKAPQASTMDELRGVEGSAAAAYFGCWKHLVRAPGITFDKRVRRPPPDPVNILLSFGYTLLGNIVHGAVEAAGLDPYLGGLHAPRYGRPSLVLDLMEELRPVIVDTAVLRAVNTRAVVETDFVRVSEEDASAEDRWEREEYGEADADGVERRPPRRALIFGRTGIRKWLSIYERRLDDRAHYPPRDLSLELREIVRAQVHLCARHIEGSGEYRPFLSPV